MNGGESRTAGQVAVDVSTGTAAPVDASIIVIAYNEAGRIAGCLTALCDQQFGGTYEVVVVDDGSSDGTAAIAERFAPLVRVERLERNMGRGHARARGVATSRGRLVGFVDADITVPAHWLATAAVSIADGAGAVSGIAVPDGDVAVVARVSGARPRPVHGSGALTGNNMLCTADVLAAHHFDPTARLGEDFRFVRALEAAGVDVRCLAELHVHHDERKRYRTAIRWLYDSGKDASVLWATYREFRTPDQAFVVWLTTVIGAGIAPVFGVSLWSAGAIVCAATAAISTAHIATRFLPVPIRRHLAAQLLNLPLMAAYLLGRVVGGTEIAGRSVLGLGRRAGGRSAGARHRDLA